MSMMCGIGSCGEFGNRASRMRNRNRNFPNRNSSNNNNRNCNRNGNHQHQHPRTAVFREEQTDLLDVFQRRHYDLLANGNGNRNPPANNPEFVGNPPSYNPEFLSTTAHHVSTTPRSSVFDGAFSALDDESDIGHRRQSSNNPFEDDGVVNSNSSSSSNNPAVFQNANVVAAVPIVSAVAISDTEEEENGSEIPFVSALRIDDEMEMEPNDSEGGSSSSSIYLSNTARPAPAPAFSSSASREARQVPVLAGGRRRGVQEQRWTTTMFQSQNSTSCPETTSSSNHSRMGTRPNENEIPAWLDVNRITPQRRASDGGTAATTATENPCARRWGNRSVSCGTNRTNWSRLSVQTKASMGEARRSLKKTLGRETKLLKKTLGREAKLLRKDVGGQVRQFCRDQRETIEDHLMPSTCRYYRRR